MFEFSNPGECRVSDVSTSTKTRRDFLRKGAAAAIALPAITTLAACTDTKAAPPAAAQVPAAAPPPDPTPGQKADAMDAMHEKGVKAFPAKTEGKGNQPLKPRLEGGVKVYELTAEEIEW
jgi:hypothetical protein